MDGLSQGLADWNSNSVENVNNCIPDMTLERVNILRLSSDITLGEAVIGGTPWDLYMVATVCNSRWMQLGAHCEAFMLVIVIGNLLASNAIVFGNTIWKFCKNGFFRPKLSQVQTSVVFSCQLPQNTGWAFGPLCVGSRNYWFLTRQNWTV